MIYTKKTHPREYRIWKAMKARCYSPSNAENGRYQELGIQVCDRWRGSFQLFMEDMGECPTGYSIDRMDGSGDYEPSNCRWATDGEQVRNRSITLWYTHDGMTMCLKDWANYFNIDYHKLYNRIMRDNHSFEGAINPDFGKIKKNNTSGVVGVSYHKGKGVWQAYARCVNGKQKYLGQSKDFDEAVAIRKKYEEEMFDKGE